MTDKALDATVVIPVYNSAETLRRAVESVLRQTLANLELVIVDDGSRDASLMLAREVAETDARIRVIALPENRGKSYAMNRAVAEAKGRWIAVLDADDWYERERLAVLVNAGDIADVPLVADNQRFHDAAAGMDVGLAFRVEAGDARLDRDAFIKGCDPYAAFNFGMLKPLVRADFIHSNNLKYRENARLSEDFLYLVEFFGAGGTGLLLAQPLYNWTQSFGSITRQWTTTGAGAWRYDFNSALTANGDVLQALRERGDQALAALLVHRMRAFQTLHHLNEINRSRAAGVGLPRLAAMIAGRPSVWPRLALRALRYVTPHRGHHISVSSSEVKSYPNGAPDRGSKRSDALDNLAQSVHHAGVAKKTPYPG
jgi:hypothetical protein